VARALALQIASRQSMQLRIDDRRQLSQRALVTGSASLLAELYRGPTRRIDRHMIVSWRHLRLSE
jgi:hypothetical protein